MCNEINTYNKERAMKIPYNYLFKQTLKRRTLPRILQNIFLKKISISGDVIDLGGSEAAQYYSYINTDKVVSMKYADLYKKNDNIINIDFEKKFVIDNKVFDTVVLMNVVEHVYNYSNLFSESFRILKNNGRIIGVVPFLYKVHGVPNDYFRYTYKAIELQLRNSGFSNIKIVSIGEGPYTAAISFIGHKIKIKPIAYLFYIFSLWKDNRSFKKNE
jgi:SAM-dependent methyltransferase